MEAEDGRLRVLRQQHWAGLRDMARTARAINGESCDAPLLDLFMHLPQRTHAASRAGAADRAESQVLDDAGDVLAVEAAAGHHRYRGVALDVCRGKNALVSEPVDGGEDV